MLKYGFRSQIRQHHCHIEKSLGTDVNVNIYSSIFYYSARGKFELAVVYEKELLIWLNKNLYVNVNAALSFPALVSFATVLRLLQVKARVALSAPNAIGNMWMVNLYMNPMNPERKKMSRTKTEHFVFHRKNNKLRKPIDMSKEHGIFFTGESIKAILDGRKTQTRRVIKPQPLKYFPEGETGDYERPLWWSFIYSTKYNSDTHRFTKCPYGKLGDRLWVREKICTNYPYIEYIADEKLIECPDEQKKWWRHDWHKRPSATISSIHMPKWATRIWLEITDMKVEKVQDISYENCKAEGIQLPKSTNMPDTKTAAYRLLFGELWDSINARRGYSWESNPWVWVIEFKRTDRRE